MKLSSIALLGALLLLTACGSSHRVTYSGHEESTEGVPGFVNGKRVSPHVKLGQSYTVDGETFVPRYEPDYVEEGMASWYGPGFHGGKTANGEEFDKHDMTAAHRTLPLPSIVRVTMLSTGKSVFVRINDRGPFARGRIIDLSRGAAEQIGLIGKGVGKVRVEYMPAESQRFADLLAQGREPKDIDIAEEVIGKTDNQFANSAHRGNGFWSRLNPISSAQAEPAVDANATIEAAPVSEIASNDLPPANLPAPSMNAAPASPFAVIEAKAAPAAAPVAEPAAAPVIKAAALNPAGKPIVVASAAPSPAAGPATAVVARGPYVQIGAFQQQANAMRAMKKYSDAGSMVIVPKPSASGATLYHVRMGPFASNEQAESALDRLSEMGVDAKITRE